MNNLQAEFEEKFPPDYYFKGVSSEIFDWFSQKLDAAVKEAYDKGYDDGLDQCGEGPST